MKTYWKEDYDLEKVSVVRYDLEKIFLLNQKEGVQKHITMGASVAKIRDDLSDFFDSSGEITKKTFLPGMRGDSQRFFTIDGTLKIILHSINNPTTREYCFNVVVSKDPENLHNLFVEGVDKIRQQYENLSWRSS